MKTTLEIPDALFRQAKAAAAERGVPLRTQVSEALAEELSAAAATISPGCSPSASSAGCARKPRA